MDFLVKLSTIIGGFATGLAVIFVIATLYVYRGQLREMKRQLYQTKKAREIASILFILQYINDVELRRARHFIYEYSEDLNKYLTLPPSWENQHLLDEKIRQWSAGRVELQHIDLWINALNNIAFLLKKRYAPSEVIYHFTDSAFLNCKKHLIPYITYRQKRHLGSDKPYPEYAMHVLDMIEDTDKRLQIKPFDDEQLLAKQVMPYERHGDLTTATR